MQPLFLTPSVEFEKTSAQTQLSEDPNAWPHELLQELYKQAPYVADFAPHVVMEKVDGEKGYGLGHVDIGNQTEVQTAVTPSAAQAAGLRHVRVPVVIKDGMLCPFDLLVTEDSKVLPLTEVRLRAAIFRPQAFDVTSRTPGDQSMIGQLYPPYRQSYGFGGGGGLTTNMGMGKEGSALESFLLEDGEKTAVSHSRIIKAIEGVSDPVRLAKAERKGQGILRRGKGMSAAVDQADTLAMGSRIKRKNPSDFETFKSVRTAGEKTAGELSDFSDQFLDADYLHGQTQRQIRVGKKVASGDLGAGSLSDFVEKNASALKGVLSATPRGAATIGAKATQNTAAAKSSATAAMVRA